jgi:protein-tyrosine phosphatase
VCPGFDGGRHGSRLRISTEDRSDARRDNRAVHVAVDLHCHILPGLDDGARDLDDALAMARQAEADGIAAVCATPHIRHDHDVQIPELASRRTELAAAIAASGCRTRILPGGEVAVSALDHLDDDELAAVALGPGASDSSRRPTGRWILLEPAPGPLDDGLELAVGQLRSRGFRALIAHPERHPAPDLAGRLARLTAADGALIQVTAAFFTDDGARPGMLALARAGVAHVLGSDAHSSRAGRPLTLSPALSVLRTVDAVRAHLEWIARIAPQAIVAGQDVAPPFTARA